MLYATGVLHNAESILKQARNDRNFKTQSKFRQKNAVFFDGAGLVHELTVYTRWLILECLKFFQKIVAVPS